MPTLSKALCQYGEDQDAVPSLSCNSQVREMGGCGFGSEHEDSQDRGTTLRIFTARVPFSLL